MVSEKVHFRIERHWNLVLILVVVEDGLRVSWQLDRKFNGEEGVLILVLVEDGFRA